ncbi:hypothetical protein EXE49_11140 [Halorubrum sp. ASP121]|uniref:hypothetical protein n=1 Tax=Halorubrum sp. ASP121 TaxID=1855858 RepID=UPI0010F6EBBB|nr:hypothetical protein [Halorubrum sp. ASP121]TKX49618.1 hypothetical protein EXE49_11140 [Halorubrum sp. ASP121]
MVIAPRRRERLERTGGVVADAVDEAELPLRRVVDIGDRGEARLDEFFRERFADAEEVADVDETGFNTSKKPRADYPLSSESRFILDIDESEIDVRYHVRALIETGALSAGAVDYYMTEVGGKTQTEWVTDRSVDQSTVSGNVIEAKKVIEPK